MSDKLSEMWKSEDLINTQAIDEMEPETLNKLLAVLNKIK